MKNTNIRKTNEEFIREALQKHGSRYNYSSVKYIANKKNVEIICSVHGSFFQTPKSHLRGAGCSKCKIGIKKSKYSKQDILEKFKLRHNNKYEYNDFIFENTSSEIKVKCPEHGWYDSIIKVHLKHGCKFCYYNVLGKDRLKSVEEFITKAAKTHNNRYDYSNVKYLNGKDKVEIICPIHGSFFQGRHNHLNGNGCPKCKKSKGELRIERFLLENDIKFIPQFIFHDCRRINPLPFDFYLPDFNVCIEFDGVQHSANSKRQSFYYSEDRLINDEIKDKYCSSNNITLIRIPYTMSIVESYLTKTFKNLNIMTTEEKKQRFITKSIELWGYKYDYSRVDYIDNTTPVTIGYKDIWYKQTPSKHLQGKKIEMQERRMPTENFIAMSKKVWGEDRFDYSECEYLGNTKKVKLYDKVKKRWIEQSPKSHLKGFEVTKLTAQEFVNECDIIYENKYTYDTSGYVNLHSRVKLICPEHGVSEKKASSILYTSGCSKCVSTKCISQAINLLKSKSISYIHNYKFDDLDIPFKIYIPAYRTCIEFDSRVDKDELLKERDALKQSYCEDNYIDLIRIRYDQLNKVERILWNALKGKLVFQ